MGKNTEPNLNQIYDGDSWDKKSCEESFSFEQGAVRLHGRAPYRVFVLHGGPGAMGSAADLGESIHLSCGCGVAEPMQTERTVAGLMEELEGQILRYCFKERAILVGHSWGAWLAGLFAAHFPERVAGIILIGAGPLEERYVSQIAKRRERNLSSAERAEWNRLLEKIESAEPTGRDECLLRLGQLSEKADGVNVDSARARFSRQTDGEAYRQVWAEAGGLRQSGSLLSQFMRIRCPIYIIHGKQDPHPYRGVTGPLAKIRKHFGFVLLRRCGHEPWIERRACKKSQNALKEFLWEMGLSVDCGDRN